jgi:hypothetical protein
MQTNDSLELFVLRNDLKSADQPWLKVMNRGEGCKCAKVIERREKERDEDGFSAIKNECICERFLQNCNQTLS